MEDILLKLTLGFYKKLISVQDDWHLKIKVVDIIVFTFLYIYFVVI